MITISDDTRTVLHVGVFFSLAGAAVAFVLKVVFGW